MKCEDAQQLADNALDELATALDAGKSEALTNYLATMSRFHRYSFRNLLLIAAQRSESTHVAGFTTWKKLGRHVRKGEKGIAIFAPLVYKQKDDESQPNADEESRTVRGYKVVHVFDVAQTDGNDLPEFASVTGEPGESLTKLEAIIVARGITLEDELIQGGALGVSRSGAITVRPDLEIARRFAVLVHELSHEMLHKGDRRQETTKTVRETEAEAVAFVVCRAIGLETGTASSDYIQLYRGSKETLTESLHHIQQTAMTILQDLLSEA